MHLGLFDEGSKSIFDLYFDVGAITCEKKKGIAYNANNTRNRIARTDTFWICFLSRPGNKYNGFTWNKETYECFGIENALVINDAYECCESCIFNG